MTEAHDALTHDMKRRSVLKAAAWTAPVVAAASIAPMAAASDEPLPVATHADIRTTVNPAVGSNFAFTVYGSTYDADAGGYVDATLPAGTTITLTLGNNAAADRLSGLVGVTIASGSLDSGTVTLVTTAAAPSVRFTIVNPSPVGGTFSAEALGGSATATVIQG